MLCTLVVWLLLIAFDTDGGLQHADITFEPVPSDYAILKVHTLPETGGDTLWASGYEVYDRLSPAYQKFLEGLNAVHNADFFRHIANGMFLFSGYPMQCLI